MVPAASATISRSPHCGRARARCAWRTARTKCIASRLPSWSCRAIGRKKLLPRSIDIGAGTQGMSNAHFKFWPEHATQDLIAPATNLFYNAEVSARRYPDKPYLVFYDTLVSFSAFFDEAQRVAGYLEQQCGVRKGDRVLLLMQNSPQFMIGYYGILRANAVVVPLNPMNLTQEIRRYADDAGASTLIVSQELYPRIEPLLSKSGLKHVIVAAYSDYLRQPTTLALPEAVAAPRLDIAAPGVTLWRDALAAGLEPGPLTAGPDDLCVMP